MLGAHVSAAGGLENAFTNGESLGCDAIQIFTRNQRQWRPGPLKKDAVAAFHSRRKDSPIGPVISHGSYLINLASPDRTTRARSLRAFQDEMERAERLGLDGLIFHPGSHRGRGVEEGIRRVAEYLNRAVESCPLAKVKLLIETTAGQGHSLGGRLEEIAALIDALERPERFGVALDTCHLFAAGYDLRTRSAYRKTIEQIRRTIGLERIGAIHLNDSKGDLGSHLDRHEHIGKGRIGVDAFAFFVRDRRWRRVPKILETPGGDAGYRKNLKLLRRLAENKKRR